MKKIVTALTCATIAAVSVMGFAACGKEAELTDEAVNLVAVTAEEIIGERSDIDYYVVPEPAATTKVNAISSLNFVGDLQELYGGENGYPQAVIVAKNTLLGYDFVGKFLNLVKENEEWLLNESTSSDVIVNAVTSHLTEGMSPTFTANNLSKSVIEHCGINLTYSYDDKNEIISFMEEFNSVSDASFETPSDSFFHGGVYPDALYDDTVKVYAPDGAPALGLAKLMADEATIDGVDIEYNIVDATLIQTYVTGADPAADICVLPVNLAVKLLGSGENYQLVGTLTHGNLYMVSESSAKITTSNLTELCGKTVGVVNLAAVPGLTFKVILKNNGIKYAEVV